MQYGRIDHEGREPAHFYYPPLKKTHMKKIIAAFDGLKYSESTTAYATHLAKQMNAHLVGVFLDDFTYHSYKIYELIGEEGVLEKKQEQLEEKDAEARNQAVTFFEEACHTAGVNYNIHHDRNIAIQELLHETVYADLLVIDSNETFTHYEEEPPTRFVRDLLSQSECPVLLVPSKFKPFDKTVLLYNGEPVSVYAIKMFSYLLPSLKHLQTEVISVKNDKESLHVPDNHLVKEYMKRHFPNSLFTVLRGTPEKEIIDHISDDDQNALIVLGAYQRGMVSRWFRSSMADHLMRALHMPLFIAHNK
jgi:nucleotide-binding universal stress UspA family protein